MVSPPAAERHEEHQSEAERRALEPNRSALISCAAATAANLLSLAANPVQVPLGYGVN